MGTEKKLAQKVLMCIDHDMPKSAQSSWKEYNNYIHKLQRLQLPWDASRHLRIKRMYEKFKEEK